MKNQSTDPSVVRAYLLALSGVPATEWPPKVLKRLQMLQLAMIDRVAKA
jgi:hypothetical protein